jgi:hypothetical protein
LYMGKKVLVIPMKQQYEQHCNAAGAADLGVPVIKSLKKKHIHKVDTWIMNDQNIKVNYKDETSSIIEKVLAMADTKLMSDPSKKELIKENILSTIGVA